MKISYIILITFIYFFSGALFAQTNNGLSITGEYVYASDRSMNGAGYSFSYQYAIKKWFAIEGGYAYSMASYSDSRGEYVNNIQLLEIHNHHAGYHFYVAGDFQFPITQKIWFDVSLGPLLSYQSNLYDNNYYRILDSDEFDVYPNDIIDQTVNEGMFFGGIFGMRLAFSLSANWSLIASANVKAVPDAESLYSAGLGFKYRW